MFKNKFIKSICLFIVMTLFTPKVYAMKITIDSISGDLFELEVESSDEITKVKEKIEAQENISKEKQQLVFDNKTLEEGRTIADYNIYKGNTVYLFLSLSVKYETNNLYVTTNKVINIDVGDNILISNQNDFSANIEAISGYNLPETISIYIGENELSKDKYTYDKTTGNVLVAKELLTDDIKIVANADKIYNVIFDANGGQFKNNNETLTFSNWHYTDYDNLEKPIKEGYDFLGYYTEKTNGTKLENILAESGIDADMTFYARWQKKEELINPDTFDNIIIYFITLSISIVGLAILTKKHKF